MKRHIGWRIWTAVCIAVSVRPFVKDNVMYMFTCFVLGVVVELIGEYLEQRK